MGKWPKLRQQVPTYLKRNPSLRAEFGSIQRRIRDLTKAKEATQREVAELRRAVAEQAEYLNELSDSVQLATSREDDLRAMLLSAHEQLMNRADAIRSILASELQQATLQRDAPEQSGSDDYTSFRLAHQDFVPDQHSRYQPVSGYIYYQRLRRQIQQVVHAALPPRATVIVVSKGDEELLELGDERRGWHFPQNEQGVYAGYYPADSAQAIAHLEELRAKGGEFLLFPETAFWWLELEKYEEFGRHLDSRYRRIHSDETCVIYRLSEPQAGNEEAQ